MGLASDETLSAFTFIPFLRNLFADCPDEVSRFARLLNAASKSPHLANNNNNNNNNNGSPSKYGGQAEVFKEDVKTIELAMSDFVPMIQDIIDTHQGTGLGQFYKHCQCKSDKLSFKTNSLAGLGFLRDAPEFHSRYITTVVSRIFYQVRECFQKYFLLIIKLEKHEWKAKG